MNSLNSKSKVKLIRSATQLFKEKGYENVSVREICEDAGVSRSSFYLFFSEKSDIFTSIVENVVPDFQKLLPEFLSASNDYERIFIIIDAYLSLCEDFGPEIIRIFFVQELSGHSRNLPLLMSFFETALKLLNNCQKSGIARNTAEAEHLLRISFHICRSEIEEWAIEDGAFNLKERIHTECDALFDIAPEYRLK